MFFAPLQRCSWIFIRLSIACIIASILQVFCTGFWKRCSWVRLADGVACKTSHPCRQCFWPTCILLLKYCKKHRRWFAIYSVPVNISRQKMLRWSIVLRAGRWNSRLPGILRQRKTLVPQGVVSIPYQSQLLSQYPTFLSCSIIVMGLILAQPLQFYK